LWSLWEIRRDRVVIGAIRFGKIFGVRREGIEVTRSVEIVFDSMRHCMVIIPIRDDCENRGGRWGRGEMEIRRVRERQRGGKGGRSVLMRERKRV
jgi:hypothetical protein